MSCTHPQCDLCGFRSCHRTPFSDEVKSLGGILVCPGCIRQAVKFAHDTACYWGGTDMDRPCGKPPKEAPGDHKL
jgi:hypothetical protein